MKRTLPEHDEDITAETTVCYWDTILCRDMQDVIIGHLEAASRLCFARTTVDHWARYYVPVTDFTQLYATAAPAHIERIIKTRSSNHRLVDPVLSQQVFILRLLTPFVDYQTWREDDRLEQIFHTFVYAPRYRCDINSGVDLKELTMSFMEQFDIDGVCWLWQHPTWTAFTHRKEYENACFQKFLAKERPSCDFSHLVAFVTRISEHYPHLKITPNWISNKHLRHCFYKNLFNFDTVAFLRTYKPAQIEELHTIAHGDTAMAHYDVFPFINLPTEQRVLPKFLDFLQRFVNARVYDALPIADAKELLARCNMTLESLPITAFTQSITSSATTTRRLGTCLALFPAMRQAVSDYDMRAFLTTTFPLLTHPPLEVYKAFEECVLPLFASESGQRIARAYREFVYS